MPIADFLRVRSNLVLLALVALALSAFWLRGNHYRDARDQWRATASTQADATRAAMREVRGKAATGQRSLYALVGRSGPQPPVVSQRREAGRTIATVTDPNTGRIHEISSARPLPPLF